jgi:hypothetical protein
MPYFFIVPAYVLLLLVLGIAAFVARMSPGLRGSNSYIIGGMIGTLPGFIVANVLVTLAGILPAVIADQFSLPDGLKQVCGVFAGVALLLGPFIASAVGVVFGFLGGCWVVRRRTS